MTSMEKVAHDLTITFLASRKYASGTDIEDAYEETYKVIYEKLKDSSLDHVHDM